MTDRFDIEEDTFRLRISGKEVEHVAEIHIRHATKRCHMRKADAPACRPVEHRCHYRAGLRHKGDMAPAWLHMAEGGIEPRARRDDAETMRPCNAQQMGSRRLQHLRLKYTAFFAKLTKPRRDDNRRLGTALTHLIDQAGHTLRRRRDNSEVRHAGQARHIAIDLLPEYLAALVIDRPDWPRQPGAEQIGEDHISHRPRSCTRPDQRDRAGRIHAIEIANGHVLPRLFHLSEYRDTSTHESQRLVN